MWEEHGENACRGLLHVLYRQKAYICQGLFLENFNNKIDSEHSSSQIQNYLSAGRMPSSSVSLTFNVSKTVQRSLNNAPKAKNIVAELFFFPHKYMHEYISMCNAFESFVLSATVFHRSISSVAQLDACPTGHQEVVGSWLRSGTILSLRLIMKSFLRSFSPFHWFKKESCQLLAKKCALSTG